MKSLSRGFGAAEKRRLRKIPACPPSTTGFLPDTPVTAVTTPCLSSLRRGGPALTAYRIANAIRRARRPRPAQIRGDYAYHTGCNRAPVENIVLDNHTRMPVPWCRTSRRSKVKPVHLSLLNHAYQRPLTARRTLALIPFSRGCSAGSEPPA